MLSTGLSGLEWTNESKAKIPVEWWADDSWSMDWWIMDRLDRLAIDVFNLGTDYEYPESPVYVYSTHCIPQQSKLHQTS